MTSFSITSKTVRGLFAFAMLFTLFFSVTLLQAEEKEATKKEVKKKKPEPIVIVSKETTFFTKPLLKNGRVDYLRAINQLKKPKGLIPAKNGAVYLVKATGPDAGPDEGVIKTHFANLLKALGVKKGEKGILALPTKGAPVLIDYRKYLALRTASLNKADKKKWREDFDKDFDITGTKPWKKEDYPKIWKWVQMNEQPLKLVKKGTEQPFYYLPYVYANADEKPEILLALLLPIVQNSRAFARLHLRRAMNHLQENRPAEAAKDLMTTHKLARQIGNRGTLIDGLVGLTIESIALSGDIHLAQHAGFSEKQLQEYIKSVQSLPAVSNMKDSINIFERCMSLDTIQHLASSPNETMKALFFDNDNPAQKFIMSFAYDWNLILRRFNKVFDEMHKIDNTSYHIRMKLHKQKEKEWTKKAKLTSPAQQIAKGILLGKTYRSKVLADILMNLLLPAISRTFIAEERLLMRQELGVIHFQLEIYKREHKKYPAMLSALVPKYLAKIPKDRFLEKTTDLKYKSDGKTFQLYSVGRDGKDNKGASAGESKDGFDIVIEVPQRVKKKK